MAGQPTILLESRYTYDAKGQLIGQEDPGTVKKVYTYDNHGNCQSFRLNRNNQSGSAISLYYMYDIWDRLKQVRKDSASRVILAEYEYDIKGNRTVMRNPQAGIETRYQYNHKNQITVLESKRYGAIISSWKHVYEVDGNLLRKTDQASSLATTITYQYDGLGRLTEENDASWKRTLYTYDSYSNRIKMMVEGKTKNEPVSVTSYQYDNSNRLEMETKKQGKVTELHRYCYDANGNETFRIWERTGPRPDYPGSVKLSGDWKQRRPTIYEWRHYNGFNQLIKINQDEKEIEYQYRGDGLRHSRKVRKLTSRQGKTTVLCWDGEDVVAEQVDGEKEICYLRGNGLVAKESDHMVYYYILNFHGDVEQLWNVDGTRKALYEYDAFGNEKDLNEKDENPFRYCGEYFDVETETVYLRARDYRALTGRFTSQDPINAGLNWYTYCENNPINRIDPLGLDSYILYDPNMHPYSIKTQMDELALQMGKQYRTEVHLIETENWNSDTFETWWNDLPGNVDAIAIATHGTYDRIQFDKKNDVGGRTGANYGLNTKEMSGLEVKDMDMLLLLGCNTGHLDRESIGQEFAKYVGNSGRVVAPDGSATWFPAYYSKKPIPNSLASIMTPQARIDVANAGSYRELRSGDSKRSPAGFVSFYNQNGITYNKSIWRAGFMTNMGDAFSKIWNASRPFYNMNSWNGTHMA